MFLNADKKILVIDNPFSGATCLASSFGLTAETRYLTAKEISKTLKDTGIDYDSLTSYLVLMPAHLRFARAAQDEFLTQNPDVAITGTGLKRAGNYVSDVELAEVFRSLLARTTAMKDVKGDREDGRGFWPQSLWARKVSTLLSSNRLALWANRTKRPTLGTHTELSLQFERLAILAKEQIEEIYAVDKTLLEDTPVWTPDGQAPETTNGLCVTCGEKSGA